MSTMTSNTTGTMETMEVMDVNSINSTEAAAADAETELVTGVFTRGGAAALFACSAVVLAGLMYMTRRVKAGGGGHGNKGVKGDYVGVISDEEGGDVLMTGTALPTINSRFKL